MPIHPSERAVAHALEHLRSIRELAADLEAFLIVLDQFPAEIEADAARTLATRYGVRPGERIVVDGQYRLTDGARIRSLAPQAAGAPS